jgi:hypothetical protein
LGRFARVRRWFADVEPIVLPHLLEVLERANLFGHFLAQANHFFVRMMVVELGLVVLALRDESVHTVESHSAVVANNAPPTVGVRETSDDV